MKVLVAVASKHGSTREIAQAIADEIRAQHVDAEMHDVGDVPDLEGFDAVVLGSAIYAGSWLPEAKQFVERLRPALAAMPLWLFSSGPLGSTDPQPQDDPARITASLGDLPVRDHRIFVGMLDKAELSLPERVITKVVRAPEGDFRNWTDIRAWARKIAEEVRSEGATA